MLKLREPTGRFGRWGQIGSFWLTLVAINLLVVELFLDAMLDASDGVKIALWTAGFAIAFYGHFLHWIPRRNRGVSLPGDHTGSETDEVAWHIPGPGSGR